MIISGILHFHHKLRLITKSGEARRGQNGAIMGAVPADTERLARAEWRGRHAVILRSQLDDAADLSPITGAEAISLASRLTIEAWSISGQPWPEYDRPNTPYRFTTESD